MKEKKRTSINAHANISTYKRTQYEIREKNGRFQCSRFIYFQIQSLLMDKEMLVIVFFFLEIRN